MNIPWKRKTTIGPLGPIRIHEEPPKEFVTMAELLQDAEKYHQSGEIDVRNAILKSLSEYIDFYTKPIVTTSLQNRV